MKLPTHALTLLHISDLHFGHGDTRVAGLRVRLGPPDWLLVTAADAGLEALKIRRRAEQRAGLSERLEAERLFDTGEGDVVSGEAAQVLEASQHAALLRADGDEERRLAGEESL